MKHEKYTEAEPDYMNPDNTVEAPSYGSPLLWFHHKRSNILGACVRSGPQLTHFEEYAHDQSMAYRAFQDVEKTPPLSYSLIAHKTK